jgi:hypothetical protein
LNLLRALVGLALIFVYHIPRLLYRVLLVSYAYVFNNPHNLTANPAEHLKRAQRLLRDGRNSELLYAALELRFALERMLDHEILMSEQVSKRMLDETDPTKKLKNLRRFDPNSEYAHDIYFSNTKTGERFKWGDYKPLDSPRIRELHGRLGDLLHPKRGLRLGVKDDPWYTETRSFLQESASYLSERYEGNTPFFAFEGIDHIEMVRAARE